MKIHNAICKKILKDKDLSLKLSMVLDIKQISVEQLARRKSNKLLHFGAVKVFKEFGYDENQIIEQPKKKASC